ncbi:MAG: 2-oxoglutarate dehydrogenase complex dihydrolipoyllysine-residue succinyltransferase, partial [Alphaproteobacteria bacterium]|nr:2-oxoglutarate dehydrogenase complex dihydrolipoyllysine-residue succinyltransferase [Alphaproteobacteria bacterium]
SVTEATIAQWYKQVGQAVALDEPLCELETDKVSVEVPAQVAGVLTKIVAQEGDTVEIGALLGAIDESATASVPETPQESTPTPTPTPTSTPTEASNKVMPSAKRMIEEHGLSAQDIKGTGKAGRITKTDVVGALNNPPPQTSTPTHSGGEAPLTLKATHSGEERVKMTRLRQTIAKRLKESQDIAAQLTTFNEVDMSALMDLRREYKDLFLQKFGVKLGFMGFFARACVAALQDVPAVNAEIDGDEIIYKHYVHMGIAVGTDKGLVVPVVRDVQNLNLAGIESAVAALGAKAREGALTLDDLQGGTFTISNGGVYGSLMSTPILNMPQSGILGMHKIQTRAVVINGEIVGRPMMYLALSYDHRIVDGKEAVTFLVRVKESLEAPERLLLDI